MAIKELSNKIIELSNADLELRNHLIQSGELFDGYHPEMEALHVKNAEVLEEIIQVIGFPTEEKVGEEASKAAWLVIQHAISKPNFMRRCASLLEEAVHQQNASPIDLAYLKDRIAVLEGKPQLYGTQFDWDENGELNPNLMDDVSLVDKRRKEIGLNSIAEQTKVIRQRAQSEGQSAPEGHQERHQQMTEWRRKVGWID